MQSAQVDYDAEIEHARCSAWHAIYGQVCEVEFDPSCDLEIDHATC